MKFLGRVLILFVCIVVFAALRGSARAQVSSGPLILFTWRAENYAPPEYIGKILPISNSRVVISAELINQGKVVNLSERTVNWFLDDKFITGGPGLQKVTMRSPGTTMYIRVEINGYDMPTVSNSVEIPVAFPQAVITYHSPLDVLSSAAFQLTATPYFFNIVNPKLLSFNWLVNGVAPTNLQSPDSLAVSLNNPREGDPIAVSLSIKNPNNDDEMAAQSKRFIFSAR
jgi:hypothetical protein